MKKFIKGDIETVVDDNDPRIPSYFAAGWQSANIKDKTPDCADKRRLKAINDAVSNEEDIKKRRKAPIKKINDVIKANEIAATESEVVNDGLIK